MTDLEPGHARELVGRAGDQAPPMPEFDLIVARAQRQQDRRGLVAPSAKRHRGLVAAAAIVLLVAAGSMFWWTVQDQNPEQIVVGDQPTSTPSVEPAPPPIDPAEWTEDVWPAFVGLEGLELRYALDITLGSKVTGYTDPEGLHVTIEVTAERTDEHTPNPPATQIQVDGDPGLIQGSVDGDSGSSTRLTWVRDGFELSLRVEGPASSEEVIAMAETVVPISAGDLPVAVMSSAGLVGAERFDVATATVNGDQFTLQAGLSADGTAFSLWLGPNGDGGGPYFLLPDELLTVIAAQTDGRANGRLVVSGMVDQSVTSLSVRPSDGLPRPVEIQSRSLGFDAAFFLTMIEVPAGKAVVVEAYGADGTVLEAVELAG